MALTACKRKSASPPNQSIQPCACTHLTQRTSITNILNKSFRERAGLVGNELGGGGGGGYSQKNWVGVCGALVKPLPYL